MFSVIAIAVLMLFVSPSQARTHSCSAERSKTVQWVGNVRIFTRSKPVPFNPSATYKATYACSRQYGKRYQLRTDDFPGTDEFTDFAVAGRFLGYVMHYSCGACDTPAKAPLVLDLNYGRTSFRTKPAYVADDLGPVCAPRTEGCRREFVRLLMRRTASFAVAYSATPLIGGPGPTVYAIEKHELGTGLRSERITLLDRVATESDLATLTLTGNTLSWLNAGQPKSATIR